VLDSNRAAIATARMGSLYNARVHPIRLYAHRGASAEAPENTMPSFRRALEIGVDALEMDVHLTRDGVPVVSHDPHAMRMAQTPVYWKDIDIDEAKLLDMGWGFMLPDGSRPFLGKGVQVPTFEEVLVELPDVVINVDVKQAWPPMAQTMVDLVRKHGAEERVVLASFHWSVLVAARARGFRGDTALSRGEVATLLATPGFLWRHVPLHGTAAQIPTHAGPLKLDGSFLDKCHRLGLRVDYWTINEPDEARRLLDAGADGIMTDDPRAIAPVFDAVRRASAAR
jgi:glycerophosphoryl diester phosphodiesterase